MPTIAVDTSSTNFGSLPTDVSQLGSWLSQYVPSSTTIYQSEQASLTYMLDITNGLDAYVYNYGYDSLNFVSVNDLRMVSGSYTVDYYGNFSSGSSTVTRETLYDSATGISASETGTYNYSGYPVLSSLQAGSAMTGASVQVPDPATPSSDISDLVLLNTSWNGSSWSGYTTGFSSAISDIPSSQMIQINYFNDATPISYAGNTPSTTGFLDFSTPQINNIGVQVSNYSSGALTDSLLVSGFSYSSAQVTDDDGYETAVAGNDVVSISGAGSLDVLVGLASDAASISAVTLYDSAANVQENIRYLEVLAAQGKLSAITLTDSGTPTIELAPSLWTADAQALSRIVTVYDHAVLPCYAAGTHIATHLGYALVEDLRVGDCVQLATGASAAIVWLGFRRIDCRRHNRAQDVQPVCISAHAFGVNVPRRDVRLSPDHAVFMDGVLIPVRYLLNGATVRQENVAALTYWHIELSVHGVLLAEGLPAESYLDTGNRAAFANAGTVVMADANFARDVWQREGCAPLVTDGPVFENVYRRLIAQAQMLGWRTTDAGGDAIIWVPPDNQTHQPDRPDTAVKVSIPNTLPLSCARHR